MTLNRVNAIHPNIPAALLEVRRYLMGLAQEGQAVKVNFVLQPGGAVRVECQSDQPFSKESITRA